MSSPAATSEVITYLKIAEAIERFKVGLPPASDIALMNSDAQRSFLEDVNSAIYSIREEYANKYKQLAQNRLMESINS